MQIDASAAAAAPAAAAHPLQQKQRENKRLFTAPLPPVAVHVVDGHGYVWDADDARRLRQDHRIVGAMIGAVAGFKQQNAASGLPLRLLPEELGVALDKGWARGYRLRGERGRGGASEKASVGAADPFLGDDAEEEEEGGIGGGDGNGNGNGAAATTGSKGEEEQEERRGDGGAPSSSSSWREGLAQGTHLTLAAAAPESLRVYFDGEEDDDDPLLRPRPNSRAAASHSVFRDLHARGYCLTPGANFGAHWLAYPSDPMLYHAQLCVRVCCSSPEEGEEEESGDGERQRTAAAAAATTRGSSSSKPSLSSSSAPLCPTLLAAASRGAHAARKHLLLAYPNGGGWKEEVVHYLTIAPEAGFGS